MELGDHTVSWSQAAGTLALKVTPGPRNFRGKRAEEKALPLDSHFSVDESQAHLQTQLSSPDSRIQCSGKARHGSAVTLAWTHQAPIPLPQ